MYSLSYTNLGTSFLKETSLPYLKSEISVCLSGVLRLGVEITNQSGSKKEVVPWTEKTRRQMIGTWGIDTGLKTPLLPTCYGSGHYTAIVRQFWVLESSPTERKKRVHTPGQGESVVQWSGRNTDHIRFITRNYNFLEYSSWTLIVYGDKDTLLLKP